jgi:hypothetical protein
VAEYGSNILINAYAQQPLTAGWTAYSNATVISNGFSGDAFRIGKLGYMEQNIPVSTFGAKMLGLYISGHIRFDNPTIIPIYSDILFYMRVLIVASEGIRVYTVPCQAAIEEGTSQWYTFNKEFEDDLTGITAVIFKMYVADTDVFVDIDDVYLAYGTATTKTPEEVKDELKADLPRLLRDYNTQNIVVGQKEKIIAMINAYVTEDTELTGQLSFAYTTNTATSIIIRIKDNDTEELFAPVIFLLPAGRNTLSIPHAYLSRHQGYHVFTVTAQVLVGSVTIATRGMFYVIDGSYAAYSMLDVGSIVTDIAASSSDTSDSIGSIYATCIDYSTLTVKKSFYGGYDGFGWTHVTNIGGAIDAAIDFDGTWDMSVDPHKYVTDTTPWISWITSANEVYVQQIDVTNTYFKLATRATKIAMLRAWNNTYTPGNDQGLIVAYIKQDGKVYYRNRCLQSDGKYIWEVERKLSSFVGTATAINLFKTNDYRVGFSVTDNASKSFVYISTRNWAGLAIPQENIAASVTGIIMNVSNVQYNIVGDGEFDPENYGFTGVKDYLPVENIDSEISIAMLTSYILGDLLILSASNIERVTQVTDAPTSPEEGDGYTTDFATLWTAIENTIVVKVDGITKIEGTDYTIQDNYKIVFNAAPAPGKVITASYSWADYGSVIRLVLDHGVSANSTTGWEVNSETTAYSVNSLTKVSDLVYDLEVANFNASSGNLTVNYANTSATLLGEIGQTIASDLSFVFLPTDLKEQHIILEPAVVQEVWNE